MKKVNKLKKELKRMKKQCMHCMMSRKVEDTKSK